MGHLRAGLLSALLALALALVPVQACIKSPPIHSAEHPGWRGTDCFISGCHERGDLPSSHDQSWRPPDCVDCHGANGVCVPAAVEHEHQSTDDCVSCHIENHGYTRTPDCIKCHYAETGTIACAD